MITLLEFTEKVREVYLSDYAGHDGLCAATTRTASRLGWPYCDVRERDYEFILDDRILELAPAYGGDQSGYYWVATNTGQRLAVLDHIINELKEQEHGSESQGS